MMDPMVTTVPLSDFSRRTTEVTKLVAEGDVILGRRDAADLYLSTRERHEREVRGLQVATRALAALAAVRPDLAADALTESLPWVAWLPVEEKVKCLQELLGDLRAGADTGELRPFFLSMAAWQSSAIAWADPDNAQALRDAEAEEDSNDVDSVIGRPGA
ncbi:hypothetical protein GCM10022223_44350 [Kineosporia mesophila]|uniref:Prevent-host-death family protein n=1 Tax=Kineosporia mesophila TaxID=566012 RepID=A0ABP7A1J6_9ACTN